MKEPGTLLSLAMPAFLLALTSVVVADDSRPTGRAPERQQFAVSLSFIDHPGTSAEVESSAVGITADGRIFVRDQGAEALRETDRMRPEQLTSLLEELEQTGRLREIDSRNLERELRTACQTAGFAFELEGAAITVIRCQTSQGPVEVRCSALSVMAARFPDFPEVQRLLTTQLRLQNVAAVAYAGGEQASAQLAQVANQTLQLREPDLPPLTPRDLSMIRQLSTGSRYVQFYRAPSAQRDELLVSVFETPGQPPRVSVLKNPTEGAQ